LPYRAYHVLASISVPGTLKATCSVFEGAGRVLDKPAAVPAFEFMIISGLKYQDERVYLRMEGGAKLAL
jgi:hypothetical protein